MITSMDVRHSLERVGLMVRDVVSEPRLPNRSPDFVVRASAEARPVTLIVEFKDRPHLVELKLAVERLRQIAGPDEIPVIAASFMGKNRRALLKDLNVGYFDLAGNAYLRGPGLLIDQERSLNPFGYEREVLNPFSDKASIVLRSLFEDPDRPWKIREMAKAGSINPGWVSRVVDSLAKRGFVKFDATEGVVLQRWEEPLKEWADLYDWRRNKLYQYYCHARGSEEVMNALTAIRLEDHESVALGFQAGASLVSPHATFNQVHLIIDGAHFDAIHAEILSQLKLEPGKEGANLVIVRPYHRHSALFGSRKIRKWRVVSDIQLYLDLHRYPLRGEEQASHLWDNVIRPRLEDAFKNAQTKARS
jgi:hypothetical protein